jgi:hypothetical protein
MESIHPLARNHITLDISPQIHLPLSVLPRTNNTRLNERSIGPSVSILGRSLSKLVRTIKTTCSPASVSKVNIRVLVQELNLLAKILLTASSVTATSLGQHSLPAVLLEPGGKGLEGGIDVVLDALGVGSGVVAVKILVYVHDEVVGGAIRVLDGVEGRGGAGGDEGLGAGVALTGHEDDVALSSGSTDGSYDSLHGRGPLGDVGDVLKFQVSHLDYFSAIEKTYMRFVHDTKGDLGLAAILGCQLLPNVRQLRVGRSTLADNTTVPSSVVVEIQNTQRCTRAQASLYKTVVLLEVGLVQSCTKLVVEQELPANWQTESVKTVVLDEVVHLTERSALADNVVGLVRASQGTSSVS